MQDWPFNVTPIPAYCCPLAARSGIVPLLIHLVVELKGQTKVKITLNIEVVFHEKCELRWSEIMAKFTQRALSCSH